MESASVTGGPFRELGERASNAFDEFEWGRRDAVIRSTDGTTVFEQKGVEAPVAWSGTAVNVVASKYFRGHLGAADREDSVRDLVDRVTRSIANWGYADGYFEDTSERDVFRDDLVRLVLSQSLAFNSPVWFNVGIDERPLCSACYISSVEDSMESIMDFARSEARIFKNGGGSGANLSNLRGSRESLAGGGTASGPVSFMRGFDAFAGVIKSGGKCLAPFQRVFTVEYGPIDVFRLNGMTFHVLSFDPPTGRVRVKRATAWKESKRKRIVRIVTDKGSFRLSEDHPMKLATGEFVEAARLKEGTPLFASQIDLAEGYVRVGLRDGIKGRDRLHRMTARDVLGFDVEGKIVHHDDEDRLNNDPKNLKILHGQSEHMSIHGRRAVRRGECAFANRVFPKRGDRNGMYRSSEFWRDEDRSKAYRAGKSDEMRDRDPRRLQDLAARSKMMNTAWRVLSSGASIETFDDYYRGRVETIGKVAIGRPGLLRKIEARFGTYDAFREEVAANNHRVRKVVAEEISDVYDVEVFCETIDDKSPESGHNFMICDFDGFVGSGVFVSNTRRAAKMVVLNVDHPDVRAFVRSKRTEETKARALIAAGYDAAIDGEAYASVYFQNANHSVRVTDDFMKTAEENGDWALFEVKSGAIAEKLPARELLREISETAWACGDPGLQFDDATNRWHTCPSSGRINGSNPCGEFMFLDDSACNLASLNLRKFQGVDGRIDVERFRAAVDVAITAQDVIVDRAAYPTEAIERNARRFRPLGLGYANLGAFVMAAGYPYDSDESRGIAASITALMTARAYRRSAELAEKRGAFEGFDENRSSVLEIVEKHRRAVEKFPTSTEAVAALNDFRTANALVVENGVRNAQVTLLAPTGTVAFMMDCDTTGIEPDYALVKTKSLVGGGTISSVNGSVPDALVRLGYNEDESKTIIEYLKENGSLAVGLVGVVSDEHLPVFDAAAVDSAGRSISVEGHLGMMAAVQPFLSGAISKTVNLPKEASIEDVEGVFVRAHELGLKAITVYRDGCKAVQPLEAKRPKNGNGGGRLADLELGVVTSTREKLPDEVRTIRQKVEIAGALDGYVHAGLYPDGRVGEVFIRLAKEGSTIRGLADSLATAVSIGLQYGVPMDVFVEKFSYWRFEPFGYTSDRRIGFANSIVDYVFRWLGIRFPNGRDGTAEEVALAAREAKPSAELAELESSPDAPFCAKCSTQTRRNGSCFVCPTCATTTGCS